MKKILGLPPNIDTIRMAITPPEDAVFCYGEKLYTLYPGEIPEDVLHHESIHTKQQGKDIERWWRNWINSKQFRYEQELEAYAHQMNFVKGKVPAHVLKEALFEMATHLATIYGLNLSIPETESKIRNLAKQI